MTTNSIILSSTLRQMGFNSGKRQKTFNIVLRYFFHLLQLIIFFPKYVFMASQPRMMLGGGGVGKPGEGTFLWSHTSRKCYIVHLTLGVSRSHEHIQPSKKSQIISNKEINIALWSIALSGSQACECHFSCSLAYHFGKLFHLHVSASSSVKWEQQQYLPHQDERLK